MTHWTCGSLQFRSDHSLPCVCFTIPTCSHFHPMKNHSHLSSNYWTWLMYIDIYIFLLIWEFESANHYVYVLLHGQYGCQRTCSGGAFEDNEHMCECSSSGNYLWGSNPPEGRGHNDHLFLFQIWVGVRISMELSLNCKQWQLCI